jgi:hypothetical protein
MAHSANSFAVPSSYSRLWKAGRSHTPFYPATLAARPWPSDPLCTTQRRFRPPGLRSPWGPDRRGEAPCVLRGLYVERPPPHVPAPTPPGMQQQSLPPLPSPLCAHVCSALRFPPPPPLSDSPHQDTLRTSVASLRRLLNSSSAAC